LIEGKFVDFSTSRNVLLKYMDSFEDTTYVLLMDVGDVLNGKEDLKKMIPQLTDSAYNVLQKWKLDDGTDTDFYNVRLIKTNEGWKYFREIHEVLINDDKTKFIQINLMMKFISIKTDRTIMVKVKNVFYQIETYS